MDTVSSSSDIIRYLDEMGNKSRLAIVSHGSKTLGWATFFILDEMKDVHRIHQRPMWDTSLIDFPQGKIIYIDKLAVSKWNHKIRRLFQDEILGLFPKLNTAIWFRPCQDKPDRMVVRPIRLKR